MLYNAGTWPALNLMEGRHLHAKLMYINRHVAQAFNHGPDDHTSDVAVLQYLEVVAPAVLVRVLRLRLMVRLARCAPSYLVLLLCEARRAPRSWVSAVEADLEYILDTLPASFSHRSFPLRDRTFEGCFRAFREHPTYWTGAVGRLLQC